MSFYDERNALSKALKIAIEQNDSAKVLEYSKAIKELEKAELISQRRALEEESWLIKVL